MEQIIRVNDRVQVVKTDPDKAQHLHRIGQVLQVANGARFSVLFPDRTSATFELHQLEKLTQAPPSKSTPR